MFPFSEAGSQNCDTLCHGYSLAIRWLTSPPGVSVSIRQCTGYGSAYYLEPTREVWVQGAQMVKHLPAMQETWVQSLGQEDPLEKEMATHSHILAWKIPWTGEPGRLQSIGVTKN